MGIDVYLKNQQGKVVGSVLDPSMELSRFAQTQAAREAPLLRFLDPAGDLVLNRAQASALLNELAGIIPKQNGALRATLEKVRELAEQSERAVHLYLWFIGD
jgi:hypothetical protein